MPHANPPSPTNRRTRDRQRKAAARAAAGMVPQSERNLTRDLTALAAVAGLSLRTVQRHREAGTLADRLREMGLSEICPPLILTKANPGADTSMTTTDNEKHAAVMDRLRSAAPAAWTEFGRLDPVFGDPWPWLNRARNTEESQ